MVIIGICELIVEGEALVYEHEKNVEGHQRHLVLPNLTINYFIPVNIQSEPNETN